MAGFCLLSSLDSEALEFLCSEQEVFVALSSLEGDKASGLDGFSMDFWQFCWGVMKIEVMSYFWAEFHDLGTYQRSLNSTFIVLVPKKWETIDLKDFRPNSLVAKILEAPSYCSCQLS